MKNKSLVDYLPHEEFPSLRDYPHITKDEKGIHITATYLNNLFISGRIPFVDNIDHGILDFNTVYQWPNLQQTNYRIDVKPGYHKIIGTKKDGKPGVVYKTDVGVRLGDIEIKFNGRDAPQSLIEYMNYRKMLRLDTFSDDLSVCEFTGSKYTKLGSERVGQLLSSESNWSKKGVQGNSNIFESRELLDQLVISVLFLHARRGVGKAQEILLALLFDRLKYHVQNYFIGLKKKDFDNIMGDTVRFTIEVIRKGVPKIKGVKDGNDTLLKDFVFEPNTTQSFRHWLVGKSFSDVSTKDGWNPKIKKYFADYLLPQNNSSDREIELDSYGEDEYENTIEKFGGSETLDLEELDTQLKLEMISDRERQILTMLSEGKTREDVGRELGIKKARISQIISGIKRKMNKD